jgi:hypothetical protein
MMLCQAKIVKASWETYSGYSAVLKNKSNALCIINNNIHKKEQIIEFVEIFQYNNCIIKNVNWSIKAWFWSFRGGICNTPIQELDWFK